MKPVFLAYMGKLTLLKPKYEPRNKEQFTNEIMVYSKFLTYKFYLHMDIFCFILL